MTAVIFGANGQDGFYLHQLLLQRGYTVHGVSRRGNWIHADVADYQAVEQVISSLQPDVIFHIAANSATRHDVMFENHATICGGTLNILEAVRKLRPGCKVFLSGSGLQFVNRGLPIKETDEFCATSAYAVSRIQSVYAARYFRSMGIQVYFGYFFNHESPMRPERHMSRKIALAAGRIAAGSNERLEIGDITVRKEWAFAGDIMQGVIKLVEQNSVFEATIGSGLAYSIEEWLTECFTLKGLDWKNHVDLRDGFKAEYEVLVSDPGTLMQLGWQPEVTFTHLSKMMMQA